MESGLFKDKKRSSFIFLLLFTVLVMLDQLSKYAAVKYLKGNPSVSLIPGVLELEYVENTGAAWGILSGFWILLLLFTFGAVCGILYWFYHLAYERHYDLLRILLIVVTAGAVGNGIDRLVRRYVVDFIYISCIRFPVFNIADCFVTVSVFAGLILYRKELIAWMKNG